MRKVISFVLGLVLAIGGAIGFLYLFLSPGRVTIGVLTIPITIFAAGCALLWEDVGAYLRGRKGNPAPVAPEPDPKLVQAEEMGRQIGAQYSDQAEAYIDGRLKQIEPAYLKVLQKQLDDARNQEEHSPLLVARIEYNLFTDHVDQSTEKLVTETKRALSEWDEFHASIGLTDDIDRLVRTLIERKASNFKLVGLQVLLDNADIIKRADELWRVKYPALSAAEPAPQ